MEGLEFYVVNNDVWYLTADGRNERLTESSEDVIALVLERIMDCYPEAYAALSECYKNSMLNVSYFRYLVVRRFCKCNLGKLDTTEIDYNRYSLRFEKVDCPLRGECKYEGVICMPQFDAHLSSKEMQVMRLVYEGCTNEEIADKLYISPFTVKNHIKSAYAKLEVHEKAEFIRYANKNHLFGDS